MSPKYLRGVSMTGYGPSLAVGIGVPIPMLDEEIARACAITDAEIVAPVVDYSEDYPNLTGEPLALVSYAELRSGRITVKGKSVETAALSSLPMAREIAGLLKKRIAAGKFFLAQPVETLPGARSGVTFKPLAERPARKRTAGSRGLR